MGLTKRHGELLQARGLDTELIARLGVHSCDKLGPDTIAIPYFRGDRTVGIKYRTISGEKRFSQEVGSSKIFYNWNCLADESLENHPAIICEGEIDCWSVLQCGYPRTVSVPGGAPPTEVGLRATTKYDFLADMPRLVTDKTEIIIAADADDPGSALRADIALRLGARRCKWVRYPLGCKDFNDALQRYGERGVVETLNRAQWIVGNVFRMLDIPPAPYAEPHDSGFPGLSEHYRLRLGDLAVVTGVPGAGKTTFVSDLACRMAMRHGWPVCFASFEMSSRDHQRMMRTWHGADLVKDLDKSSVERADKWINENFCFLVPDEDSERTLSWVMERFAAAALRYGARLFIIDPWNEIEHDRPDGMSLTEYVGIALREMKSFARKYEAHLILVAHPAKLRRDKDGKYPVPSLYDISDSAHFANKADVGIVVDREDKEKTTIDIAKSRFHDQIGLPGSAVVRYVRTRSTYEAMP